MGDEEEGHEEEEYEREDASWAEALAEQCDAAVAVQCDAAVEEQCDAAVAEQRDAAEGAEQVAVATSLTDTLREVEDMRRKKWPWGN